MFERNLLNLSSEHAAYIGNFGLTTVHAHGAPVILLGLSGPIKIGYGQRVEECRSVIIDANIPHFVDCQGERLATIYLEVGTERARHLRQYYFDKAPIAFNVHASKSLKRDSFDAIREGRVERVIPQIEQISSHDIDKRIAGALATIQNDTTNSLSQAQVAKAVNLSTSRLTHLFKHQSGVSYRRFRLWSQLGNFMRDVHTTKDITTSALNTGFYDSSHLSNSYKKTFGINPMSLLSNLSEFSISA